MRSFFDELISAVLPVEMAIADQAARLRSGSRSLRMPDALILATADTNAEVESVVTGEGLMRGRRVAVVAC